MSFYTPGLTACHDVPLQQHPAFAAALTHLGRPPLQLARRGGAPEMLVMRRRFGPLGLGVVSRSNVDEGDRALLRRHAGCRWLLVNAETGQVARAAKLRHGVNIAELTVSKSAAAMRQAMAQKWRNRLNRGLETRVNVAQSALPPDPSHWLLRAEALQQKHRRYRGIPPVFSAAYAAANRGQARLFEARRHGNPIAAMLFLCHGSTATYQIGWSGPEGREACAHQLLLWKAMLDLPRRGIEKLDLGCVDTETAPGLARFKLGAGATCRKLGGTYLMRL